MQTPKAAASERLYVFRVRSTRKGTVLIGCLWHLLRRTVYLHRNYKSFTSLISIALKSAATGCIIVATFVSAVRLLREHKSDGVAHGCELSIGVGQGEFTDISAKLDTVKVDTVSLPIALGLWLMMWPVLTKARAAAAAPIPGSPCECSNWQLLVATLGRAFCPSVPLQSLDQLISRGV